MSRPAISTTRPARNGRLLRRAGRSGGRALIVATHDTRIFGYADRIAHMEDGRILESRPQPAVDSAMKLQRLILPFAAVLGLIVAVLAVMQGERGGQVPRAPSKAATITALSRVQAPFESHVAGTGVVEAGTGNIAIGTPVSGIVAAVPVRGVTRSKLAPLFQLDDRDLRAQLPLAAARQKKPMPDGQGASSRSSRRGPRPASAQRRAVSGPALRGADDEAVLAAAKAESIESAWISTAAPLRARRWPRAADQREPRGIPPKPGRRARP